MHGRQAHYGRMQDLLLVPASWLQRKLGSCRRSHAARPSRPPARLPHLHCLWFRCEQHADKPAAFGPRAGRPRARVGWVEHLAKGRCYLGAFLALWQWAQLVARPGSAANPSPPPRCMQVTAAPEPGGRRGCGREGPREGGPQALHDPHREPHQAHHDAERVHGGAGTPEHPPPPGDKRL
jgi:hypothetical protein